MTTPYRDDHDALQDRRRELVAERETVRARREALGDLERLEASLDAEIEAIEQRLLAAEARRALPVLEDVRIASPCDARWEAMEGDERVRFCGHCEKHVYNLAGMTRGEAERLLRESTGELCVRLYQREDGTVLTADCAVGARRRRRRRLVAAAALAGGGTFAAGALLGGACPGPPQVLAPQVMPEVEIAPQVFEPAHPPDALPQKPIRPRMGKMQLNRYR